MSAIAAARSTKSTASERNKLGLNLNRPSPHIIWHLDQTKRFTSLVQPLPALIRFIGSTRSATSVCFIVASVVRRDWLSIAKEMFMSQHHLPAGEALFELHRMVKVHRCLLPG